LAGKAISSTRGDVALIATAETATIAGAAVLPRFDRLGLQIGRGFAARSQRRSADHHGKAVGARRVGGGRRQHDIAADILVDQPHRQPTRPGGHRAGDMAADRVGAASDQHIERARGGGIDGAVRGQPGRRLRLRDRRQSARAELTGLNLRRRHGKAQLGEFGVERDDIGAGESLREIATLQDHFTPPYNRASARNSSDRSCWSEEVN
jgi:hypothetical protein